MMILLSKSITHCDLEVPVFVIFPGRRTGGVLQVTGGVDLAKVPELMKSISPDEKESEQHRRNNLEIRFKLGKTLGTEPSPTGNAPRKAENAIANYRQRFNPHLPEGFGSRELHGLLSLMSSYIVSANSPKLGYAKTMAPLMARTDFAAMFKLLHENEQTYFRCQLDVLVALVADASGRDDMQTDLFPQGIYNDPRAQGGKREALQGFTCRQWVLGIINGTDYLTAAHFNKNPDLKEANPNEKKEDLESMGAMGSRTEKVGNEKKEAPIFEIRSIGELSNTDQLKERVLEIFDIICSLNQRETET